MHRQTTDFSPFIFLDVNELSCLLLHRSLSKSTSITSRGTRACCIIDLYRNRSISRQGPRTVWEEIDARASRRGSLLVMMCRALRTRHFPSPCFSLLVRLSSRPSAPLPLCSWQETGVLATGDWRALLPLARLECLRLHVPSIDF